MSDRILREDGFVLLLEGGSRLLLERATAEVDAPPTPQTPGGYSPEKFYTGELPPGPVALRRDDDEVIALVALLL